MQQCTIKQKSAARTGITQVDLFLMFRLCLTVGVVVVAYAARTAFGAMSKSQAESLIAFQMRQQGSIVRPVYDGPNHRSSQPHQSAEGKVFVIRISRN